MKRTKNKERNWLLVVVASVVILCDTALLVVAAINTSTLGWWALGIAVGAILSLYLSIVAIKTNNPAWLLLDFILPN